MTTSTTHDVDRVALEAANRIVWPTALELYEAQTPGEIMDCMHESYTMCELVDVLESFSDEDLLTFRVACLRAFAPLLERDRLAAWLYHHDVAACRYWDLRDCKDVAEMFDIYCDESWRGDVWRWDVFDDLDFEGFKTIVAEFFSEELANRRQHILPDMLKKAARDCGEHFYSSLDELTDEGERDELYDNTDVIGAVVSRLAQPRFEFDREEALEWIAERFPDDLSECEDIIFESFGSWHLARKGESK